MKYGKFLSTKGEFLVLVYHGSNMEICSPDPGYGRFNLDFGKGFYVTTLQAQAEKWAPRLAFIHGIEDFIPFIQ